MRVRVVMCGLLVAVSLIWGVAAYAQGYGSSEGEHPQQRQIRREMIAACIGKSEGAPCTFPRNGEAANGTCRKMRQGAQLICRGAGGHHGHRMGGESGGGMPPGNAPGQ